MGLISACVSDVISNSLRVLKTTRQTAGNSYLDAARAVIARDGVLGLFTRGLSSRLLANGMQAVLFSVVWKGVERAIAPAPSHAA